MHTAKIPYVYSRHILTNTKHQDTNILCWDIRNQYNHDYSDGSPMQKFNPYPTAFPYGNGMVLHFYQQQENSTTKTVHKVINKGLKTYV